jgi:putative ABC transport system ATP-binding protein
MLIAGKSKEERHERAMDLLEKVGLLERKDHKPDELSGGERQRVAIARALANHPLILLADEPTGDLDTETGLAIIKLLKEINKIEQQTLILVTHDGNIANQSERIFHITDGLISSVQEVI